MRGPAPRVAWIPPFLVGAVGAAAGELAAGLLLYAAEGFLRSLTIVLATEMLGLALGLASTRRLDPADLPAVRRRWLMILLAYVGGTGFSAAWEMSAGFSAAPLSQALGLLLLGGVPLFSVGSVLGALAVTSEPSSRVGTPAALGAAGGVVATGLVAVPELQSVSLFLFCVVIVAGAALLHGWLLDERVLVRVLVEDRGEADEPVIRLEERIRARSGTRGRVVTVDGRPAAGGGEGPEALLPWERAAANLLTPGADGPQRILVVGIAGSGLERSLEADSASTEVVTLEPWARVRRLRSRAGAEAPGPDPGTGDGWAPGTARPPFGAVVVSLRLLPGGGPVAGPGLEVLEEVASLRSETGLLILGGASLATDAGASGVLEWISRRPWCPESLVLLRPPAPAARGAGWLLLEEEGRGGGLVVGRPDGRGAGTGEPAETEVVLERSLAGGSGPRPMERRSGP